MDAAAWDERYRTDEYVWRVEPNRFLVDEVQDLVPGRALDLACGEGRNAVWLAERGWDVTGVDFSEVGIEKGRRLAADRGVDLDWVCADVVAWAPKPADADLVIVFYLQVPAEPRRLTLARAMRGLAPEGTLVVVGHDSRNPNDGTGGPQDAAVLYAPADIVADLETTGVGFDVVRAETVARPVDGADRPALDCLVRVRRQAS